MKYDDAKVLEIITKSPQKEQYPDADALILLEDIQYTIDNQGRVKKEVLSVQKYFTVHSYNVLGDPRITYHNTNQKATLIRARTFPPDGDFKDIPSIAQNRVTPVPIGKSNRFSDYRDLVITYSGLDLDAVTDLRYEVVDTASWRKWFCEEEFFQSDRPYIKKRVGVKIPKGTPFLYAFMNGNCQFHKTEDNDYEEYEWIVENSPLVVFEGNQEELRNWVPYLAFSTCPDWKELANFLGKEIEKAIVPSPEISKKVKEISQKFSSKKDLVFKIHSFVNENINLVSWHPRKTSYKIEDAASIYMYSNGNILDKVILFMSMLKDAGFDPKPLFIADRNEAFNYKVPTLNPFGAIYVSIPCDNENLILEPSSALESQKELGGKMTLVLDKDKGTLEAIPQSSHNLNKESVNCEINIADDMSVEGKFFLSFKGSQNPYFKWVAKGSEKGITSYIQSWFKDASVTQTTCTSFSSDESTWTVGFKVPKWAAVGEQPLSLKIPSALSQWGSLDIYRSRRESPLILPSSLERRVQIEITLPKNIEIVYQGKSQKIENKAGSMEFASNFSKEDKKLKITKSLVVLESWIPTELYPDFKKLWVAWEKDNSSMIIVSAKD